MNNPGQSLRDRLALFCRMASTTLAVLALFGCARVIVRTGDGLMPDGQPATDNEGFIPLFGIDDLEGWTHLGLGSFQISEGIAETCRGRGVLVYTNRVFRNFVLRLDFRQNMDDADSGVLVRFPDPKGDPEIPAAKGYQVEIYKVMPGSNQGLGAIDNVAAPFGEVEAKEPGRWNTMEITCVGQEYAVAVNGKTVTRHTGDRALEGYIGLQNHDPSSVVHFRSLRIRELP